MRHILFLIATFLLSHFTGNVTANTTPASTEVNASETVELWHYDSLGLPWTMVSDDESLYLCSVGFTKPEPSNNLFLPEGYDRNATARDKKFTAKDAENLKAGKDRSAIAIRTQLPKLTNEQKEKPSELEWAGQFWLLQFPGFGYQPRIVCALIDQSTTLVTECEGGGGRYLDLVGVDKEKVFTRYGNVTFISILLPGNEKAVEVADIYQPYLSAANGKIWLCGSSSYEQGRKAFSWIAELNDKTKDALAKKGLGTIDANFIAEGNSRISLSSKSKWSAWSRYLRLRPMKRRGAYSNSYHPRTA